MVVSLKDLSNLVCCKQSLKVLRPDSNRDPLFCRQIFYNIAVLITNMIA